MYRYQFKTVGDEAAHIFTFKSPTELPYLPQDIGDEATKVVAFCGDNLVELSRSTSEDWHVDKGVIESFDKTLGVFIDFGLGCLSISMMSPARDDLAMLFRLTF